MPNVPKCANTWDRSLHHNNAPGDLFPNELCRFLVRNVLRETIDEGKKKKNRTSGDVFVSQIAPESDRGLLLLAGPLQVVCASVELQ